MKATLKKRILSGLTVLVLAMSTLTPVITVFGEDRAEAPLYEVMSETTNAAEVTVFSSSDDSGISCAKESDARIKSEEGLEVIEKYAISDRKEGSEETLWVKADPAEEAFLQSEESMSIYSVEDDKIKDVIVEDIADAEKPSEIEPDVTGIALVKDSGYRHRNFDLNPVSLDGMMPKNATAEAIDVAETIRSSENAGCTPSKGAPSDAGAAPKETILAAYDITIRDGKSEYQPSPDRPVSVSISDPQIRPDSDLHVFHIKDDGTKEEIKDVTTEDGKVCFDAVGFSVYEIVQAPDSYTAALEPVTSVDALSGDRAAGGFYLYYGSNNYFTNRLNSDGCLIETTTLSEAAVWYFESSGGSYGLYTYVDGDNGAKEKKYIKSIAVNENKIQLSASGDLLTISNGSLENAFYLKKSTEVRYLQHSNGGKGIRYYKDNTSNETNSNIKLYYADKLVVPDDYYELDGKTYGLMNYSSGTHGNALMADDSVHSLVELVTHKKDDGSSLTLYVDEGSEVTRWSFHNVNSDRYRISANVNGAVKYLAASGSSLILVDSEQDAAAFQVIPAANNRIRLKSGSSYISLVTTGEGDEAVSSFALSEEVSDNSKLALIDFAHLTDEDLITFSADRISISDVENGQRVIIYTRIWDDVNKKYDMYAVDCDGSLYPCYASGGKILWLGDGTGTLEWEFTEYYDSVTKLPNYYYELYNPYSEKYIAPQLSNGQVISDTPIGINMNGRRNGDFYSDIVAWDNTRYAYVGLKPNDEKTKLVPCSQSTAIPFYFATLEDLNLSDRLHEVPTLDNKEFGVTMKMFDFGYAEGSSDLSNTEVTKEYFDNDYSNKQGLLNTNLTYEDDDGYPTVKKNGKSFKTMYEGAEEVNHLFLESIYNSSGYFEYDSCQNFATLMESNDGKFTVYRELGTTNGTTRPTLQHGQFLPYNTIEAGKYSTNSPQNLYNMDALVNNTTVGQLDPSDPRKYESLLGISNPDYFFGMEMSASFVQTVSGLDAWGHDIIFDFTGDDDFWFYVDGELVIDLGGTHSAEHGRVNFRTGEITYSLVKNNNSTRETKTTTLVEVFRKNYRDRGMTEDQINAKINEIFDHDEKNDTYVFKDYTTHSMRVFYMERGAGASNLHMRFNLAAVTPGNVVISKSVSGEGADLLDQDFLEYPFQIYYKLDGDSEEKLLENDDEHIRVSYQNSNQPVSFINRYRPPGVSEENAYHNVYFINPTKNAEISFPDDTIFYRIVECAVDRSVYSNVLINGNQVPEEQISVNGNYYSYSSRLDSAENKPVVAFDNVVEDDVIKDLIVTKKLYSDDACENEVTDDPATFNFRLYLSSVDIPADEMERANMYKYFVLSPEKKFCFYDPDVGTFAATDIDYSYANARKALEGSLEGYEIDDLVFRTSPFGAISGIPAGYSICVPGLTVGSIFKITEDTKEGYGLVGYERVMGDKLVDGDLQEIPSYEEYDGNPMNVGRVKGEFDSQMIVKNRKGYSLTVKKKWSDLDITTWHDSVYVAVYADGELLDGSVREIKSPNLSAYYFWPSLRDHPDGTPRTDLTGYVVKEVKLNGHYTVDDSGAVSGSDGSFSVIPYKNNARIEDIAVTRTPETTPEGEGQGTIYDYIVSYHEGAIDGTNRTDVIQNTRDGGIRIRLFKWDSEETLSGGTFVLKDENGTVMGTCQADSEGTVTILYNLDSDKTYTLKQTAAPNGYVGVQKTVGFQLNTDRTISLLNSDGTGWGSSDTNDMKWARSKPGEGGYTAFIDIYNKPFNFIIEKTDNGDNSIKLSGAHFALYKQANTTINGYVKNKFPMDGFEDFSTTNGMVYVCGGDSGRVIKPGKNGSVFFLTEKKAPHGYTELKDDIVFRVSALGVPSLISDSYQGVLAETEDSYVYTLSVPNAKSIPEKSLTVRKTVSGNMGSKFKNFDFTFEVSGGEDDAAYPWSKDGAEQDTNLKSGDTFALKHGSEVVIQVPQGLDVTITEASPAADGYVASFRIDSGEAVTEDSHTVKMEDDVTIEVTNTREAVVPTGIWIPISILLAANAALFLAILHVKRRCGKLKEFEEEE